MPLLTDHPKAAIINRAPLSVIPLEDAGNDEKIKPFPAKSLPRRKDQDKAQFNTERIFKAKEHEYL
ncbi:hypothetical protein [Pollutibacter soli]|uniref:hypothetical protein n=1 Tax=Pollutibacter soli TaxID=3034157 RepID=UPI00301366E7